MSEKPWELSQEEVDQIYNSYSDKAVAASAIKKARDKRMAEHKAEFDYWQANGQGDWDQKAYDQSLNVDWASTGKTADMRWWKENQRNTLLSALTGDAVQGFSLPAFGMSFDADNVWAGPETLKELGFDPEKLDQWKAMMGAQGSTPRDSAGNVDWGQVLSGTGVMDALKANIATGSDKGFSPMDAFHPQNLGQDASRAKALNITQAGKGTAAYASAVEWLQQDRSNMMRQNAMTGAPGRDEAFAKLQPGLQKAMNDNKIVGKWGGDLGWSWSDPEGATPDIILNQGMAQSDKALAHGGWLGSQGTAGTSGLKALEDLLIGGQPLGSVENPGTDVNDPIVEEILG